MKNRCGCSAPTRWKRAAAARASASPASCAPSRRSISKIWARTRSPPSPASSATRATILRPRSSCPPPQTRSRSVVIASAAKQSRSDETEPRRLLRRYAPRNDTQKEMTEHRLADPILMEVFSNRLLSITEEMGTNLIRASFSTNIKERRDCSVGLFDAGGRLIAQAAHIPLHLGSLLGAVEAVRHDFPIAEMRDGDAFLCNDPYLAAGTHMPDISVVTPVFVDGEVRFFTANIGHHADVGGLVPGSIAADALSVFEEGIRIPATRIRHGNASGGELDRGLLRLIAENTREPEERRLDLMAQIAANDLGARRVLELVAQTDIEAVTSAIDDILSYTAQRLRNRIAQLKPGSYTFTTYLDDDGGGNEKAPLTVTVHVEGGQLHFDFAGSAPQSRGALNVPESGLKATVFYAVKALLDQGSLPHSGLFEAVRVTAPEGSIVNPRFPSAVGARSITCQKIAGASV